MNFRIFIDAATLKLESYDPAPFVAPVYFRIFIDAATLKPESDHIDKQAFVVRFPHLYRCGHIEA